MGSRTPIFKRAVAAFAAFMAAVNVVAAQDVPETPFDPTIEAPPDASPDAGPDAGPDAAPEPTGDPAAREADLLAQLRDAESPQAAALIESELAAIWSSSGSPAVDLLLQRGQEALAAGDAAAAVEHLTAAIDHDPQFAEARAARAAAYYLTGDIGPALDDLRATLALNPSHWQAMGGVAVLLEEIGRPADALEVWRRAADINPQSPEAQSAVDRLAVEVEGQAI